MRRSLSFSRGRTSPAPWGRRFRWLAVALLLYTLAGFFLLPALLRWQLVKRLPGLTHRQAAVQKVKFNPYALTLSIQGLALTETNGTPFAGWDELFVNFQLSSLFHRAWTFREIRLERPTATILRAASGQCNFANLGRPAPASAPAADEIPKPPPAVRIGHLIVTNGVVTFADQTPARPMRLEIHPLNLDLRNLATRRDEKGQYALTLRSADGGHWDWAGTLALNPPRSAGTFTVRGARLAVGAPYLAELTRAVNDKRLEDVTDIDFRLHQEIVEMAHHRRLAEQHGYIMQQVRFHMVHSGFYPKDYSALVDEHAALIDAVIGRKADRAEALAKSHNEAEVKLLAAHAVENPRAVAG